MAGGRWRSGAHKGKCRDDQSFYALDWWEEEGVELSPAAEEGIKRLRFRERADGFTPSPRGYIVEKG